MIDALYASYVPWFLIFLAAMFVGIVAAAVIAGLIFFGFAFVYAPKFLFSRHPLSAPYANQKPPPHVLRAMIGEIWTAILFFGFYNAWPFVRGYNMRRGQNVPPVVFVHGVAVSRTSWFWFMRMLARRGITRPMYALAFNWLAPVEKSSRRLARVIERALAEQNATQVDLVAHSWGGFLSRWYIEKLGQGARVRKLIMIGTPLRGTWMGVLGVGAPKREMSVGCPTVVALTTAPPSPPYATLWSDCDEIVVPPQLSLMLDPDGNAAFVRKFMGTGHLTMQRDPEVADLVARLLEDPSAWTRDDTQKTG
jgi:hypothetical protein